MRATASATITGFTLLLFAVAPSFAYKWVEFEPCGFVQPDDGDWDIEYTDTKRAPNLDAFIVDPGQVTVIWAAKRGPQHKGPPCVTVILKNGNSRHVLGTKEEVMKKLGISK